VIDSSGVSHGAVGSGETHARFARFPPRAAAHGGSIWEWDARAAGGGVGGVAAGLRERGHMIADEVLGGWDLLKGVAARAHGRRRVSQRASHKALQGHPRDRNHGF